jgi:hypothetical protein
VSDDYSWDAHRWWLAIEAADTWVDPSHRRKRKTKKKRRKKTGSLEPLAALFASGAPVPPSVWEALGDLFSRHRLVCTTSRTPIHQKSDSQVDAEVLAEFVDEFRRQNWPHGPITRAEMNEAVEVLQRRAKAAGQGHRKFEGKAAATILRGERLDAFTDYYFLDRDRFERALSRRHGPINRMKKTPTAR